MNIPFHRPSLSEAAFNGVKEVLESGWLTTGGKVSEFESSFASYVSCSEAIAVNSCTAALHLALEALGVQRGDRVAVPTLTFAATAEVVRYFDAMPVFIDSDPEHQNISPETMEGVLRKQKEKGEPVTVAIVVHYGGEMVDMAGIADVAKRYDVRLVEDAAHCCPSYFRESEEKDWEPVGARSDVACFSFYANKCITTGEGGMATTNDAELAERMRLMSLHGLSKDAWKRFSSDGDPEYLVLEAGYKYNMTDIAAAIGIEQLARADDFRDGRERVARSYDKKFASQSGIKCLPFTKNRINSWHLYTIQFPWIEDVVERKEIGRRLREKGISTSVHWRPLHMHPYYADRSGFSPSDFPEAARYYQQSLSLPIYPDLSEDEIVFVADAVIEAARDSK